MGQIDLKNMSLKELQTLEKKVARAIAAHEKRERKNALAELAAKAKQLGFSLDELIGDKKTVANVPAATNQKARKKVAPKYRNPNDASQTWTGRGRQPIWVKDALACGATLDSFLIK